MNIVLLPGYACKSWIWDAAAAAWPAPAGHRITALDWPTDAPEHLADLDTLADWVAERIGALSDPMILVGHSMGGLVALRLAARAARTASPQSAAPRLAGVVWVDTFLVTPPPFFRNIVLPEQPELEGRIRTMNRVEGAHYPEPLRRSLQELDVLADVRAAACPLGAVYGGRGSIATPAVLPEQLGWPDDIAARVNLRVVRDACHFAMLEQPAELAQRLAEIIASIT